MTKEERRRLEARRKRQRAKIIKGTVICMLAVVTPLLIFLAMRG